MAEGLATEDGAAIDLDAAEQEFAAAMAAPEPDEAEHPAPPKREQPSEDELGAKYGWTTGPDGQRRAKRAKGRPRTKARVTDPPPPQEPQKPAGGSKGKGDTGSTPDYRKGLSEFTGALWMVMAAAPLPAESLRIKVRAQAAVLRTNQASLVQGVAVMAEHNGTIRRGVEFLTMGSAGWVLPATMAIAPFAVQSAQLWRMDPAALTGLAEQTEKQWAAEFEAMQQAFADMQAEQDFYAQHAAEQEGAMAA